MDIVLRAMQSSSCSRSGFGSTASASWEMTPFEFVALVVIGDFVQQAITTTTFR